MCPDCANYYNNRAAAFIMLDKYQQGLEDVQRALNIDNTLIKVKYKQQSTDILLCPHLEHIKPVLAQSQTAPFLLR